MRFAFLVLVVQACALDTIELSSIESEVVILTHGGLDMEFASTIGMEVQLDPTGASNGKYLAATSPGYCRHFFEVDREGSYSVWFRVIAPPDTTLEVEFGGEVAHWTVPPTATWAYLPVLDEGTRAAWTLAAYEPYELRVTTEKPGVKLDRVFVTYSPDFVPVAKVVEAESGSLVAPMQVAAMKLSNTKFAWVPNGAGIGGRVDLDLDLGAAATPHQLFAIWGRANAPSNADNQFLFGLNNRLSATWEPPVTSATGWTWSKVTRTVIDIDGNDVLTIQRSEDGTKLDKILVTNDWEFRLVESSPPNVLTLE